MAEFAGWRMGFVAVAVLSLASRGLRRRRAAARERFVPMRGGLQAALDAYAEHLHTPGWSPPAPSASACCSPTSAAYTYVNFYLAAPPFELAPGQLGMVFGVYLVGAVTTGLATRLAVADRPARDSALAIGLAACGLLLTLRAPGRGDRRAGLMSGGLFVVQALSLGFIAAATRHGQIHRGRALHHDLYIGGALGGVLPGGSGPAGWPGVVALLVTVLVATSAAGLVFWREPGRR